MKLALAALLALAFTRAAAAAPQWVDVETAPPLKVENLGEPVRSMRYSGDFLIPKPEGAGWWFVLSYNPIRRNSLPCQIYTIDLDTKQVAMRKEMPAGALSSGIGTHGAMGKDGLFYMPFLGTPLGMYSFDPRNGAIKFLPTDVDLMLSAFTLEAAPNDDRIYMGTASAKAYLVEYDTATGKYRNLGVQGPPHGAPRYIYSMAVGNDYVYSAAGKNPWYLVAADRRTGEQKVLLDKGIDYLSVRGSGDQCVARVTLKEADDKPTVAKSFRLHGLEMTDFDPAKEPATPKVQPPPKPEVLLTLAPPTSDGKSQIWFRLPGKDWDHADLTDIQTQPYKLVVLHALPDGRLIGSARDYQDCFIFDPKDSKETAGRLAVSHNASSAQPLARLICSKFTILGKPPVSFGTMEFLGDLVYLLGYPGTYMMQFDPKKPWTIGTTTPVHKEPEVTSPDSNPRECYRWSVGVLPTHFIRASAIGADGFIYFGAHAERSAVGGGLGWWDPANRKPGGLREPFLMQDCAGLAAAKNGRSIVFSSFPVSDPAGKLPKPDDAKLFVLDTTTKKITSVIVPLPGLQSCGEIAAIGDRVFGIAAKGEGHIFYAVDLVQSKVVFQQPVPGGSSPRIGPDGKLYLFIGNALVRVAPDTCVPTALGTVEPPGGIEFLGKDIYLTGTPAVRRIPGVVGNP